MTEKQTDKVDILVKRWGVSVDDCTIVHKPFSLGDGWILLVIPGRRSGDYVIGIAPDGSAHS